MIDKNVTFFVVVISSSRSQNHHNFVNIYCEFIYVAVCRQQNKYASMQIQTENCISRVSIRMASDVTKVLINHNSFGHVLRVFLLLLSLEIINIENAWPYRKLGQYGRLFDKWFNANFPACSLSWEKKRTKTNRQIKLNFNWFYLYTIKYGWWHRTICCTASS